MMGAPECGGVKCGDVRQEARVARVHLADLRPRRVPLLQRPALVRDLPREVRRRQRAPPEAARAALAVRACAGCASMLGRRPAGQSAPHFHRPVLLCRIRRLLGLRVCTRCPTPSTRP